MDIRDRINLALARNPDLNPRSASLKAGLSDSWLHKVLDSQIVSPKIEQVEKLAKVLGVDPRWLAFGEGEPEVYSEVGELLARMTAEQQAMAVEMLRVIGRTGTDG